MLGPPDPPSRKPPEVFQCQALLDYDVTSHPFREVLTAMLEDPFRMRYSIGVRRRSLSAIFLPRAGVGWGSPGNAGKIWIPQC